MIVGDWKDSSVWYIQATAFHSLSASTLLFHLIGQSAENNISKENPVLRKTLSA